MARSLRLAETLGRDLEDRQEPYDRQADRSSSSWRSFGSGKATGSQRSRGRPAAGWGDAGGCGCGPLPKQMWDGGRAARQLLTIPTRVDAQRAEPAAKARLPVARRRPLPCPRRPSSKPSRTNGNYTCRYANQN